MKELLEPVLKQLPGYVPDLGKLVTRPKTSIARWVGEEQGALGKPLVFVAVSVAIGFLLQLPRVDKEQSLTTMIAAMAGFKVVALIVFAAVIQGLFRALGGNAKFAATLSAYLYAVSPLYVLLVLLDLATQGVLRDYSTAFAASAAADPFLSANGAAWRDFEKARPDLALTYGVLTLSKVAVLLGWATACWGAFRELHGVSRWRSSVAGIAAFFAYYLLQFALQLILRGMFGTALPALQ